MELATQGPEALPFPQLVVITLTNKCNQLCLFCSGIHSAQKVYYAHTEALKLPWLAHTKSIVLVGSGEALCHPEYVTILENIHSVAPKVPITLYTNGAALRGNILDATLQYASRIDISQNSLNPTVYNSIIRGNFQQSMQNLKELSQKKGKVHVQLMMVCLKQNQHEIKNFILCAHKMGFESVKVMLGFYPQHDKLPLDSYLENLDHLDLPGLRRLANGLDVIFTTNQEFRATLAKRPCESPWSELRLAPVPEGWEVAVCCRGSLRMFVSDETLKNLDAFWSHERLQFVRRTVNTEEILANKMCLQCRMRIRDEKYFALDENFAVLKRDLKLSTVFDTIIL